MAHLVDAPTRTIDPSPPRLHGRRRPWRVDRRCPQLLSILAGMSALVGSRRSCAARAPASPPRPPSPPLLATLVSEARHRRRERSHPSRGRVRPTGCTRDRSVARRARRRSDHRAAARPTARAPSEARRRHQGGSRHSAHSCRACCGVLLLITAFMVDGLDLRLRSNASSQRDHVVNIFG